MCCDWFDLVVGIAGGFGFGCMVTAILAKRILLEQAAPSTEPLFQRTYLKDKNCL